MPAVCCSGNSRAASTTWSIGLSGQANLKERALGIYSQWKPRSPGAGGAWTAVAVSRCPRRPLSPRFYCRPFYL